MISHGAVGVALLDVCGILSVLILFFVVLHLPKPGFKYILIRSLASNMVRCCLQLNELSMCVLLL